MLTFFTAADLPMFERDRLEIPPFFLAIHPNGISSVISVDAARELSGAPEASTITLFPASPLS